jgi:hypothetical protein
VAAELGLERELAVIGVLAADRDAAPSLALNFP